MDRGRGSVAAAVPCVWHSGNQVSPYKRRIRFHIFYYFFIKKQVFTLSRFLFSIFLVAKIVNSTKPNKLLHKTTFK